MNNQTVTVKKSKITPNYTINKLLHIAAFFFLYCLLWNAHTLQNSLLLTTEEYGHCKWVWWFVIGN